MTKVDYEYHQELFACECMNINKIMQVINYECNHNNSDNEPEIFFNITLFQYRSFWERFKSVFSKRVKIFDGVSLSTPDVRRLASYLKHYCDNAQECEYVTLKCERRELDVKNTEVCEGYNELSFEIFLPNSLSPQVFFYLVIYVVGVGIFGDFLSFECSKTQREKILFLCEQYLREQTPNGH